MSRNPFGMRAAFSLIAVIALSACQTTSFYQSDKLRQQNEPLSVAVMPIDVTLVELTAAGLEETNAEWTTTAKSILENHLAAYFEERNLDHVAITDESLTENGDARTEDLVKLHREVGSAIVLHKFLNGNKLPAKGDAFDWTLGGGVESLRELTRADYAVFIHMKDQYSSAGYVAANVLLAVLGGPIQKARQTGYASLVDLHSGDIVWFNRLSRTTGDLRDEQPAREALDLLMDNFPESVSQTAKAN